jgi:hypothetical protein
MLVTELFEYRIREALFIAAQQAKLFSALYVAS